MVGDKKANLGDVPSIGGCSCPCGADDRLGIRLCRTDDLGLEVPVSLFITGGVDCDEERNDPSAWPVLATDITPGTAPTKDEPGTAAAEISSVPMTWDNRPA